MPDVPLPLILICLACGTLAATAGLALWDLWRPTPRLSRAVQVNRWIAGSILLLGAVSAWYNPHGLSPPVPRLILMAALASPPLLHRRHPVSWQSVIGVLPSLALAGSGVFWPLEPAVEPTSGFLSTTPLELLSTVCGGLAALALGEALSAIVTPASPLEWPSVATYTLLTLLVATTALTNLWERGLVWAGTRTESGLAGVWLVWSGAWLEPRHSSRLQATLVCVAAILLIVTVTLR